MDSRCVLPVVIAMLAVASLACRGPDATAARPQLSASDFDSISEERLGSAMWQLAAGIRRLQATLGDAGPITPSERLEVIGILEKMIAATDALALEGASIDHPLLARNLPRFREKLEIARRSVEMNPPRYYLVGNLSGTCLACHVPIGR